MTIIDCSKMLHDRSRTQDRSISSSTISQYGSRKRENFKAIWLKSPMRDVSSGAQPRTGTARQTGEQVPMLLPYLLSYLSSFVTRRKRDCRPIEEIDHESRTFRSVPRPSFPDVYHIYTVHVAFLARKRSMCIAKASSYTPCLPGFLIHAYIYPIQQHVTGEC